MLLQFAQQNAEQQKQLEISALQQQLVNSYQPTQQQQQNQQMQQQNPHLQQALGVSLVSSASSTPVSMQNSLRNVNSIGGITSALHSSQNLDVKQEQTTSDNTNIGKTMKLDSEVEIKQENDDSCSSGKPIPGMGSMKDSGTDVKLETKDGIKMEPFDGVKQEGDFKRDIKTENGSGDGSGDAKGQENLNASRDSTAPSPASSAPAKPRVKKSESGWANILTYFNRHP